MQMCIKLQFAEGIISSDEWNFFLRGGQVLDRSTQLAKPPFDWITQQTWDNITELEKALPETFTGIANAVGTSSVYLVDSTYLLEADTAADVIYLVGMQAFTTPIVITDDTASMDVAFTSSTGMSVFDANADDVYVTTGPFALKMTTK